MKKKIIGIFVCMLLIIATVLPVAGIMNSGNTKMEERALSSGAAEEPLVDVEVTDCTSGEPLDSFNSLKDLFNHETRSTISTNAPAPSYSGNLDYVRDTGWHNASWGPGFYDMLPSISGDGSAMVYREHRVDEPTRIILASTDGTSLVTVSEDDPGNRLISGQVPCISDDGTHIAWVEVFYPEGETWICHYDTNTGSPQYKIAHGMQPCISADGSKIAYVDYAGLWMINSDGTNKEAILENYGEIRNPYMSDTGTQGEIIITFMSNYDNPFHDFDIFVIQVGDLEPTQLTTNDIPDRYPSISDDGSKVAFLRNVTEDAEIYVIDVNTLQETLLVPSHPADEEPAADGYFMNPFICGDGSKVVFQSYRDEPQVTSDIYWVSTDGSQMIRRTYNGSHEYLSIGCSSITDNGGIIVFQSNVITCNEWPSFYYDVFICYEAGGYAVLTAPVRTVNPDAYPEDGYKYEITQMRNVLVAGGWADENIIFLTDSELAVQDPKEDTWIDGDAFHDNLGTALDAIATGGTLEFQHSNGTKEEQTFLKSHQEDIVFIMLRDHGFYTEDGTNRTGHGHDPDPDTESDGNDGVFCTHRYGYDGEGQFYWRDFWFDDEFDEELDRIECDKLILVDVACHSGEFITDCSAPRRIVLTSCDEDETSFRDNKDGLSLYRFYESINNPMADGNGDGNISVQEAHFHATSQTDSTGDWQDPQSNDQIGEPVYLSLCGGAPPYNTKDRSGDDPIPNNAYATITSPAINDGNHVVINELYYSSRYPRDRCQWLEIYNPTNNSINISGWMLFIDNVDGLMMLPNGTFIGPKQYLIIANNKNEFLATFTVPPGTIVLDSLGGFLGSPDTVCSIAMYNNSPTRVDRLDYGGGIGRAPSTEPPNSLARYKGGYDTDNCERDFYIDRPPTPGWENTRSKPWLDNFDSYVLGQYLDGGLDDGGWNGWDDDPGAGAYVVDDQALSYPYSVDIVDHSDLVHEFSGCISGNWTFKAWQYIPEDFFGDSYFILLSAYDDGAREDNKWAVQIRFDSEDGIVESEHDHVSLPLITGRWVELRAEINLDADWFEFYYDGDLLIEKAWTAGPHNEGDGFLVIDTVDLFANFATSIYYDDLSLEGIQVPPILVWVDDDYNETIPGWNISCFDGIQDGIDAVGENGMVYVWNGTYYENVVVNKTIHLIGECQDNTTVDGSGTGDVVIVSADGVSINGFTIQNSGSSLQDAGLEVASNNNVIMENRVSDNYFGICINEFCENNRIYHNNFIDNNYNAYDSGSNSWDNGYPSGGNYWDDYEGRDLFRGPEQNKLGRDGIGDKPYGIPNGNNQDKYPLMKPWPNPYNSNQNSQSQQSNQQSQGQSSSQQSMSPLFLQMLQRLQRNLR